MLVLLRCVAESVAEHGAHGLVALVPGGDYALKIAQGAYQKYRQRKKDAEIRAEIKQLAEASFDQARAAAVEAAKEVAGRAPIEDRLNLEMYLSQIPGAVRQSLKRPEDVSGRTVPGNFMITSPDDLLRLLPGRPPRFRPGDPLASLPGWSLVEPLGSGGFGEVWLTRHRTTPGLCGAVKFCHGEQGRELRHESALITRVMQAGKHKGIVPLVNAHLDGEVPWLLYDYVAGGDLSDLVRAGGKHPPQVRVQRAVDAMRQLCDAVAHCHRQTPAIIHRDLKPSNILFDRAARRLLVTDFGIGAVAARKALDEDRRGVTSAAGRLASNMRGAHTPVYSGPQQRQGEPPEPRDDVHALGVILYQLLTAQLEHGPGSDFSHYLREAGTPDPLVELVGQCVAHSPARRPADAGEVLVRLKGFAAPPASSGYAGGPASATPSPSSVAPVAFPVPVAVPVSVPPPSAPPTAFVVDEARCAAVLARMAAVQTKSYHYDRERFMPDVEPEANPLPDDLSASETLRNILLGALGLGLLLMMGGAINRSLLYIGILVVLVFGGWLWYVLVNSPYRRELERRRRAHVAAKRDARTVEEDWDQIRSTYETRDRQLRTEITRSVSRVRGLPGDFRAELAELRKAAERDAYDRYMRTQAIAGADISGVGDNRKQLLAGAGISFAHQVTRQGVLAIDGFGPALANAVVAWREDVSSRFRFDPARDLPDQNVQALYGRLHQLQTSLFAAVEGQLAELARLEPKVKEDLSALIPRVREALADLALARVNLRRIERNG